MSSTFRKCVSDDIFAPTSDTEQPMSLIEAMAARSPVVCTNVGDIPEMGTRENFSFVAPKGDGSALTASMRKLLFGAELRRAAGAMNDNGSSTTFRCR